MSYFGAIGTLVFRFLVMFPLGFKARVDSALFAFAEANVMYMYISVNIFVLLLLE